MDNSTATITIQTLTKKEWPSLKSKVGFSGARKQAGRMCLYMYSANPGRVPSAAIAGQNNANGSL